jgi:hypothetical protein
MHISYQFENGTLSHIIRIHAQSFMLCPLKALSNQMPISIIQHHARAAETTQLITHHLTWYRGGLSSLDVETREGDQGQEGGGREQETQAAVGHDEAGKKSALKVGRTSGCQSG